MDRNLFLAFALSFGVLLLWTLTMEPPPPPLEEPEATQQAGAEPEPLAPPRPGAEPAMPALPALDPVRPLPAPGEAPRARPPGELVVIETPLFRAELDSRGAGIRRWELRQYHSGPENGRHPVELTTGDPPHESVLATPFDELGLGDLSETQFRVERPAALEAVFSVERGGLRVEKHYRFQEESYAFELRVRVENHSGEGVAPRFAVSWPAARRPGQDFREQALAVLHAGTLESEALQGLGKAGFFGDPKPVLDYARDVDWAGLQTTYFVGAVLPENPAQASARLVATRPGEAGVAQVFFDPVTLPPGQVSERVFRAYLGPKEDERLEAVGGGLERAIDRGWAWLAPLTRFFTWLLAALVLFMPGENYGVAIIVLTVLVRLVTTPLTVKQMRSMERMRKLAPKLQELKEKHSDDRQKQSEEMMQLYRREGVNPLGGCFPMLLQLPVFIGLFYALRSSIQLRQAPFVGWISDLSAPDTLFEIPGAGFPFRVLPLLMGGSMLLQQKITPMQQMDPAQQRMMLIMMPLMMTFISWTFPSGLVLYWMVSNVLAISHQLWIGRGLQQKAA